jgi:hypothetical protein
VLRPGGTLWLITPVTAPGLRSRAILGTARATGIVALTPPTLAGLHELLTQAGFGRLRPLGGASIAGIAARTD